MSDKIKSGMYDEMPKLVIGNYTICLMNDQPNNDSIWIEDNSPTGGEAGQFHISSFEKVIKEYFDKNF